MKIHLYRYKNRWTFDQRPATPWDQILTIEAETGAALVPRENGTELRLAPRPPSDKRITLSATACYFIATHTHQPHAPEQP